MPPKAAPEGSSAFSAADIQFVMTVLKNVESMPVNWKAVAATVGIARADNATTKFNTILKKAGHKYMRGTILSLDDTPATPVKAKTTDSTAKAKSPEKTPKAGKKRTKKVASSGNEDTDESEGSVAKKVKTEEDAAVTAAQEDDAEAAAEEDDAEAE